MGRERNVSCSTGAWGKRTLPTSTASAGMTHCGRMDIAVSMRLANYVFSRRLLQVQKNVPDPFMKWPIVIAAVVVCANHSAALAESLPPEVSAYIGGIKKTCEDAGGQFDLSEALDHGALGLTHQEVWVVDIRKATCTSNRCLFGGCTGSGDMQVAVFLRLPDRRIKEVFDDYVLGVKLEHSGRSPKLSLKVLGQDCGQTGTPEPFDSIQCIRPMVWNEKTQELEFAPLSEAKITFAPHK